MAKKSYITRFVELVELVEIEYPDEFEPELIEEYNETIAEGIDVDDLPEEVTLNIVSSYELGGERLDEWEKESEYMPIAEDLIASIKDYKFNLEQFLWHMEFLSPEDYFKFIIYLAFNGYSGDDEEMFEEFHKKHYS